MKATLTAEGIAFHCKVVITIDFVKGSSLIMDRGVAIHSIQFSLCKQL